MPPLIKVGDQSTLVETAKYPYATFPFTHFNPVQSRVYEFYDQDVNAVIAAATSAGKTVVGEMFANHELEVRGGKFMYLCPLRALAQEKVDDWTDSTHPFSKRKVSICTGDYRLTPQRQKELANAEVVIMTSEMLNHRCRNHKAENNKFLEEIGTIVVDECFCEDSTVITDRGVMSVGEVVDSAGELFVLCRNNAAGTLGFKKVLSAQKKILKREWITIHYRGGHVQVTSNQLLFVNGEYRPACEIKAGDTVEVVGEEVDFPVESRTSRSVEVQEVLASGSHPAANTTQRRIRAFRQAVYDSLVSENVFDPLGGDEESKFASVGKKSISESDSILRLRGVQGVVSEHANDLSRLWHGVLCFNLGNIELKYVSHSRRRELLADAEDAILRLEQESVCCDIEVADHNNFFVGDGGVRVLAHNSHLLTVPGRGDHLEVGLMTLTKINPNIRVVLLSATMPNVDQIAEWVSYSLTKRQTYVLLSSYRPCPLTIHYENYDDDQGSYQLKEEAKIQKAIDIIKDYPDDKFLVFVHTKRTGDELSRQLTKNSIVNEFHNADLEKEKRISLEKRFKVGTELRVVVATSTLAWGVNLPSRRVIVLGVHRGISEVATYDIFQMVGRAGRPAFDPAGDAYILIPASMSSIWRAKLKRQDLIESQLLEHMGGHHRLLAFHIISEIHHHNISCDDDLRDWFERTLAHFQSKELDDTAAASVLKLLKDCYAVMDEDGKLKATAVGVISSMFYFSPFDVAHLRRNFKRLFEGNWQGDDARVALALANIDSNALNFANAAEREEIVPFEGRLRDMGVDTSKIKIGALKAAYIYWCMMTGSPTSVMAGAMRGMKNDTPRLVQVVSALDEMSGRWGKKGFIEGLEKRLKYGVPAYLVDLVQLPHLGQVRAKNLYAAGIKTVEDVVDADVDNIVKISKMSRKLVEEMVEAASMKAMGVS